jgi:hypothetical protein
MRLLLRSVETLEHRVADVEDVIPIRRGEIEG